MCATTSIEKQKIFKCAKQITAEWKWISAPPLLSVYLTVATRGGKKCSQSICCPLSWILLITFTFTRSVISILRFTVILGTFFSSYSLLCFHFICNEIAGHNIHKHAYGWNTDGVPSHRVSLEILQHVTSKKCKRKCYLLSESLHLMHFFCLLFTTYFTAKTLSMASEVELLFYRRNSKKKALEKMSHDDRQLTLLHLKRVN